MNNSLKGYCRKLMLVALLAVAVIAPAHVSAQFNLSDLLGKVSEGLKSAGSSTTDALGGIVDGVFTKTNLEVSDIAGSWTVNGSAVDFRSEEFLKKAGGQAAAAAIEKKIDPYYKKYKLQNSVLTITSDGVLTLGVGKYTLSGTITPNTDERYAGNFIVQFKALGIMSLGEYDTYVTYVNNPLTGTKQLRMMFDAQKLVALVKCVAALSKKGLAQSAADLLDKYDGVCVGFKCTPATSVSK